jgi:oxysterol-binding protein 1
MSPRRRFLSKSKNRGISVGTWVRLLHIGYVLQTGDTVLITKTIREISMYASTTRLSSLQEANEILLGGTSILHIAVQCAEPDVVEYIISHGSEFVDLNAQDNNGHTPLQLAIREDRESVVRVLMRRMYNNGLGSIEPVEP